MHGTYSYFAAHNIPSLNQPLGSRSECPIQVIDQVADILQPDRKPQCAGIDPQFGSRPLGEVLVGRRCRMGDPGLLASPRLFEMRTISSAFWKAKAASLPPFSSRQISVEPPVIWRATNRPEGWSLAPRIDDAPDLRVIGPR